METSVAWLAMIDGGTTRKEPILASSWFVCFLVKAIGNAPGVDFWRDALRPSRPIDQHFLDLQKWR